MILLLIGFHFNGHLNEVVMVLKVAMKILFLPINSTGNAAKPLKE